MGKARRSDFGARSTNGRDATILHNREPAIGLSARYTGLKCILILAFLVLGKTASVRAAEPAERPNVVVILADDQGWGDLSQHGNPNIQTPHIDQMAKTGARFARFFVQPLCSLTRAEFLTGRWYPRGGVGGVSVGRERLDLDERTVAEAFHAAGYSTACFGKWHNGTQYPYHPNARGFNEYYGFTAGHWGLYFDPPLDHNGQDVRGDGYITDDLTDHAIAFLSSNAKAGRPSFCYLAYNTPHSPMEVPDAYWNRFKDAPLKARVGSREYPDFTRAALAMCENIDDNVGRLLEALRKENLERNTIVVYFSDNGPNSHRWNGGMKGIKGSTDEGGVRSPLIVRWPGHIAPGTEVRPIAGAVDLYPTLIDLAGIERVGDRPFDGISLAPWLKGKDASIPDRALFHVWAGKVSARDQRFRLDAAGRLFDLDNDPGQHHEANAKFANEAKRLTEEVKRYRREVLSQLQKPDKRPFLVGYRKMPRAVLPARDGVPHGKVKRSSPAPNCSYFTHWTNTEDQITWNIDVHTAGRYEAIVQYTCPASDVGSTIALTLGKAKWTGKVTEPYNPSLHGKEYDRVPRESHGESYVKDFRPLSLGIVELPAGPGTLTLQAARVPGEQVGDVRAVELILTEKTGS